MRVLAQDFSNTDDDMTLVYVDLIQWDQQETCSLDGFENVETIEEFFELHEDITQGDHKEGFSIDLDSIAYFGESTTSSSYKIKN